MKWNLKRTLAIVLTCVCVLFAIYKPIPVVQAREGIIDQMVYYALTVSGYMKKNLLIDGVNGGGGGHQFGKAIGEQDKNTQGSYILSTLRDAFQYAYDNHNISVDSGGNINFDSTITQNFYDIVNGGSGLGGYEAKVLNGNPNYTDYTNTAYANPGYISNVSDAYSAYDQYMSVSCVKNDGSACFWIYDLSEVAYMAVNYNSPSAQLEFYDSTGQKKRVKYRCAMSYGVDSPYINDDRTVNETQLDLWDGYSWAMCYPAQKGNYTWNQFKDMYFNELPTIPSAIVYQGKEPYCYYTNRPIVVGKTANDAYQAWRYYENGTGYVNVNNYNVFPPVSNQQITNNNFQQTYNKYCDNVNTIYNTTYNDEEEFDLTAFQQIMNDQNTVVLNALNQGVIDITGSIQTTNDKLDIVIGLLEVLNNTLTSTGGQISADTQSAVYLQQILEILNERPWTTSPPSVTVNVESDTQSAILLQQIYNYIIENPWVRSGANVVTPDIEIPATGSAVEVLATTSAYHYANPQNNGWTMSKNTGTPTYYKIYDLDNVSSFKLTTRNGTRTRVMLTDYSPETFYAMLHGTQDVFTVNGNWSASLSDEVTDYLVSNVNDSDYLYVYLGNSNGSVDITDIELKEASVIIPGGSGGGGGLTSLQAREVIEMLRFLVNNQVTFPNFQSAMGSLVRYLTDIAATGSANTSELEEINNRLVAIYNAIVANGNSNNQTNNNYYYGKNYYINNKNKIEQDVDDYIDDLFDQYHFPDDPPPIIDAMTQVMPFCFLVMVTTLFSELAQQPQTPRFEIPFNIQSIGFEYTLVVDFEDFSNLHNILVAGWMILFMVCFIYVYFYLFKIIYDLF